MCNHKFAYVNQFLFVVRLHIALFISDILEIIDKYHALLLLLITEYSEPYDSGWSRRSWCSYSVPVAVSVHI